MIGGGQAKCGGANASDTVGSALIASEKRFQALTEVSLQGKLVHRRFTPLFANSAFALLCGVAAAEDIIAERDVLGLLDEESRADPERAWEMALRAPLAGRRLFRRQNGAPYPAEFYSRPVDWNGAPAVALAVLDVSAEENAQHALRQALARAEEAEHRGRWFIDAARRELEGPAATLKERLDALVRQATQSSNRLRERAPHERGHALDVLIAGEDSHTRALVKLALSGLGHRPHVAVSGKAAVTALRTRPFDAVVADLAMEEMTGLARAIRALPGPAAGTPIVALAESGAHAPREEIAEAGVDAVLGKFLDMPQLAETLRLLASAGSIDAALGDEIQYEDEKQKPDNDAGRTQGHRALHG